MIARDVASTASSRYLLKPWPVRRPQAFRSPDRSRIEAPSATFSFHLQLLSDRKEPSSCDAQQF